MSFIKELFAKISKKTPKDEAALNTAEAEPASEKAGGSKSKKDPWQPFLGILGNTKISKKPLFITYNPADFAIKGSHTREMMKLILPGDILVRRFNGHLDNYVIRSTFREAAFYLGEVTEAQLKQFAKIERHRDFDLGEQIVIYKTAQGLVLEDVINFCRCDALAVMRFPRQLKSVAARQPSESFQNYLEELTKPQAHPYPALLRRAEKDIMSHLVQGKPIKFEKVFPIFYRVALTELSEPHEFNFGFNDFHALSSTEFVYFITKSIIWNYGIEPLPRRILFKERNVIMPDDFIDADLEEIWKVVG